MTAFTPASPVSPIIPPNAKLLFVEDKSRQLTLPALQHLQQMWAAVNGGVVPLVCLTAQATPNVILLTPASRDSARLSYEDFSTYRFVASSTSDNTVTASVGDLSVLPVYKTRGTVVAGAGDVVLGAMYDLIYSSALNSNNGGFILW